MTKKEFNSLDKGVIYTMVIDNIKNVYKHSTRPVFVNAEDCSTEYPFTDCTLQR